MDFAGPFEVFSVARTYWDGPAPEIEIVGVQPDTISTIGGMQVRPHRNYRDCQNTDLLVIPGGAGTRPLLDDTELIEWISTRSQQASWTLSVCTGALLLAKANLLDGLRATTHHSAIEELEALAPKTTLRPNERFIDNGRITTAAGISAGIDASLHMVAKIALPRIAIETARHMEYDWEI